MQLLGRLVQRSLPALSKLVVGSPGMRQRASPCIFFHRGFCRFGDNCKYSHADATAHPGILPFHDRAFAHVEAATSVPRQSVCRVMSYNVLADHLAHEHATELYNSSPRFALEWGWRGKLIMREIAQYQPDLVCLQEVDHFRELQQGLEELGYEGVYTKRTGDRRDGLATFWRRDVFRSVKQDRILFSKLGLKDNVAQLTLLQRRQPGRSSSAGSTGSLSGQKRGRWTEEEAGVEAGEGEGPMLAVGNIHVLFNPRRGDIKLAQVRTLMEHLRRLSEEAGSAPAVVCGDFNSAAGSPIYQYISSGQLDLSQHERKRLSGQVEAQGRGWPSLRRAFLSELAAAQEAAGGGEESWESEGGRPYSYSLVPEAEGSALGSVLARMPAYNSMCDPYSSISEPRLFIDEEPLVLAAAAGGSGLASPQPVTPATGLVGGGGGPHGPSPAWQSPYTNSSFRSASSSSLAGTPRPSRGWTPAELHMALGGPTAAPSYQLQQHSHSFMRGGDSPFSQQEQEQLARCPLRVASAYATATAREPLFTTCHDKFIGTVDYIWYTPSPRLEQGAALAATEGAARPGGGRYALRPLSVLQPPSLQSLRTGMPCAQWPSDHVSLVADFELVDTEQVQCEQEQE